MRLFFSLTLIANFILTGCGGCPEPVKEKVLDDFNSKHPNAKLLKLKNTENSPPCFYWNLVYVLKEDTIDEYWQYCCSDIFDSNQKLRILKN